MFLGCWQISEQLGLLHVSKGESHERHIEVFKIDCKQPDAATEMKAVTNNQLSSDFMMTETNNDIVSSQDENHTLHVDDTQISSVDSEQSSVVTTAVMTEHAGSNNLLETSESTSETSSNVSCSNCGRQILQANYQLHVLNCKRSAVKPASKKSKGKTSNKVKWFLSVYSDSCI